MSIFKVYVNLLGIYSSYKMSLPWAKVTNGSKSPRPRRSSRTHGRVQLEAPGRTEAWYQSGGLLEGRGIPDHIWSSENGSWYHSIYSIPSIFHKPRLFMAFHHPKILPVHYTSCFPSTRHPRKLIFQWFSTLGPTAGKLSCWCSACFRRASTCLRSPAPGDSAHGQEWKRWLNTPMLPMACFHHRENGHLLRSRWRLP